MKPHTQQAISGLPVLMPVMAFALALAARWPGGDFLTVDEAYHWFDRVARFRLALASGDYAATNLIGHPGVTTLWLGAGGQWLFEMLGAAGMLNVADQEAFYTLVRLPIAVTTALVIALAYPLLNRLCGRRVALPATLFWIGEPFLVAHSQLLHLDALLTSFMTLSLLLMLVALNDESRPLAWSPWWLASGIAGGLALLTKSPALFLMPFAGLLALSHAPAPGRNTRADPRRYGKRVLHAALAAACWAGAAMLIWVALWPAAWVDPFGAAGRMALQASADGGSPHGWGNFFLGQAVVDPGPLFYPLTIAFRLTPWALLGIALWGGFTVRDRGAGGNERNRALLLILLFTIMFVAALTLLPKKFDRYALPAFPALAILAAAGWSRILDAVQRRIEASRPTLARMAPVGGSALLLVMIGVNLFWYHPYFLAYFNPLLGGGIQAQQVVPIGWGEGYELATAFVAAQPNGADRPVAVRYEPVAAPFAPAGAAPLAAWQEPGRVDYAIVYIDQLQREEKPETYMPLRALTPVYTVRLHGIEYAYVYQIPPPVAVPLTADFGDAIHLRGYRLDTAALRTNGAITLTLEWQARAAIGQEYALFIHVLNAAGERVAQVDVPAGGARWPTSRWEAGRYVTLVQQIPTPADLPAGEYHLAIGLYDPTNFARLPLRVSEDMPASADGGDALLLERFMIR